MEDEHHHGTSRYHPLLYHVPQLGKMCRYNIPENLHPLLRECLSWAQKLGLASPPDQTELSLWDAPVSAASTPPVTYAAPQPSTHSETYSSRHIDSNDRISKDYEEPDTLDTPTPIGKHQPSWGSFSPTTIIEEKGFQHDERLSKQTTATPTAASHPEAPKKSIDSENERSTAKDATFHDASEQHAEAEDWVLISKENVPKPSEHTFRIPMNAAQEYVRAGAPPNQTSPVFPLAYQPSLGQQSHATYQFHGPNQQRLTPFQAPPAHQGNTAYLSDVENQPSMGFQHPRPHQTPMEYQPRSGLQALSGYQASEHQAPPTSRPSTAPQTAASSQGGFRGRFIQHIRQKSSKEYSTAILGQSSPPQPAAKIEQSSPIVEKKGNEKRPVEFVGLPPIRRSSTFGLGFRAKDPSKRFALDDDEDDVQQASTVPLTSNPDNNLPPDVRRLMPTDSHEEATQQYDNGLAGGQLITGITAIATPMIDRTIQPSGEPSRYSIQDKKSTESPARIQQRPALSNISPEFSQPSSFSPVSPPVSSPVSPPGSRPTLIATPQIEVVGASTSRQASTERIYVNQDGQSDAEWQPNVRSPQEQRATAPNSYQRSSAIESQQIPPHTQSTTMYSRHTSFEGQRPTISPTHAREPPFDGQHVRSPSGQSNVGNLPNLNSGVLVQPPRAGPNQQKPFDQPPSSAQRYPELFRAEPGKEPSVDGLPAHYYQGPISKEDAFLPRQQTNEYQLPGIGPPPDDLQTAKRSSRRNSALFKELGGRLSRSGSRDRASTVDDDAHSPVRPIESHGSNGREYSAASITSEDTEDKKKRSSGLAFLGAFRRESTGGPPQSRESLVTHLPGSRTDLLIQPQEPSSPLAPPDKKRLFNNSRGSTNSEKSKPNKLSRTATSNAMAEQSPKKKRFSGVTSMFSRPSTEQEGKDPRKPAVQTGQDPRNYQQPSHAQGPQQLEYPNQTMTQEPRSFHGQPPQLRGYRAPPMQVHSQALQDHSAKGTAVSSYAGQIPSPLSQVAQNPRGIPKQEPAVSHDSHRVGTMSPPLQQVLIQGGLVKDRRFSEQSILSSQSPQSYQPRTSGSSPQPTPNSPSPQIFRQQTDSNRSGPLPEPITNPPSPQNHKREIPSAAQSIPFPPLTANSPSGQNSQRQTAIVSQTGPFFQARALPSPGPVTDNRIDYQQRPTQASEARLNPPPLQISQQLQHQQRLPPDPHQANLRPAAYAQAPIANPERQQVSKKPSSAQTNPPRTENKQRQGSTARLLSGLMGGRRSSGQHVTNTVETQMGTAPQITAHRAQQPQQLQQPHQQLQQLRQQLQQPRQQPQQQHQLRPQIQQELQQQHQPRPQIQQQQQQVHQPRPQLQQQLQQLHQPRSQAQQQQQWPPSKQMPQNNQLPGAPAQIQQGRSLSNEPRYEPLPIPGAYELVRGEGGQLAPTPYDPRGLNGPAGLHSYHAQVHMHAPRPPQIQTQPSSNDQSPSAYHQNVPQITTSAPQNPNREIMPSVNPQPDTQHLNKSTKPLSSQDVIARSPARPQLSQQAPYQLSLPNESLESDQQDQPPLNDKNALSEHHLPPSGEPHTDKSIPTESNVPPNRAFPTVGTINTRPHLSNPTLRHPLSPATYPLPEDSIFSPINPAADQVPPPPPPKWPQQTSLSQNLDRSNTIITHRSEVSQLSGQLNIPEPIKQKEQEQLASITPPSPQITPEPSPEQAPRGLVPAQAEEDLYSASPRNSVTLSESRPIASENSVQSPEKIPVDEGRMSQSGRRRTSQEEKILVEEGMGWPRNTEEEVPSMSATSYPGQEWHPYGNGYEEWD